MRLPTVAILTSNPDRERPTRRSAAWLLLGVLTPFFASAGEIYGTVKLGDAFIEGAQVTLDCAEADPPPATTDRYGSFRFFVAQNGPCTLTVSYRPSSPDVEISASIAIASFQSPTAYDLILQQDEGGGYRLVRQ